MIFIDFVEFIDFLLSAVKTFNDHNSRSEHEY